MAETAGGVGGWAGGEGGVGGWVGGGGGWSIGKCFNVFFASGSGSQAFALVSFTLPLRLHLQNTNMI
jgi:hypothetical protein